MNNAQFALEDRGEVFRDFEISRIQLIGEALRLNPVRASTFYILFLAFWTISMSYGASVFTENPMAVNLTPHLSLHSIIVGLVIYPKRMYWIPVACYTVLYFVPFALPFTGQPQWISNPATTANVVLFFFCANLLSGTIIGMAARAVFDYIVPRLKPLYTDFLIAALLPLLMLFVCYGQILVTYVFAGNLDPAQAAGLGFDDRSYHNSLIRILLASVIDAAFLVATYQLPTRKELISSSPAYLLFPLLALAHNMGYGGFPTMDTCIIALLVTLTINASAVPAVILLGMTTYESMTGNFVVTTPLETPEEEMLGIYTIALIMMLLIAIAYRGWEKYSRDQRAASLRRLSTVSGFAGIGLFTANVPRDTLRLDHAGRELVGLPASVTLAALTEKFRADERYMLQQALKSGSKSSITMLLHLTETVDNGDHRVLRLHLWSEPTFRGEKIVYGLMVEVTAEYLQEKALTDALNELSLRQDRQQQLFSIVSHEIRTPASVLSMLIDDLNAGHISAEQPTQMREAADQLLSVLDDMRQAVNPEKNQPLSIEPYIPSDVAERLRNTYQLLATDKDIRINLDLGQGANQTLMGDSKRLKQILGNLIRNAIIHSGGSEIRIAYRAWGELGATLLSGGNIPDNADCWSITDNGVGIPLEDLERLFQPFERGSADARNQAEGSGLGLFIAKQTVNLLGGDLHYFNAPEGGAGYVLVLDDTPATPEASPASPEHPVHPAASKNLGELNILLAEDNDLVAKVTSKQLGRSFGKISHAENGRKALQMIIDNPPDVLLTDLFMPEMPGDELIQALREAKVDIPMIGLTAAVVGDDINRFEEAGATAVLPKPLDVAKLRALLDGESLG